MLGSILESPYFGKLVFIPDEGPVSINSRIGENVPVAHMIAITSYHCA